MAKRDIYQQITNKIVDVLDRIDLSDYEAPFAGLAAQGLPKNLITDKHYRGINIPALWIDQQEKGFTSNRWATFKQWKEQGASVLKGERGSQIIIYKTLTVTDEDAQGEECETSIPMLKGYTVFNANQVEGYEGDEILAANQCSLVDRIEAADEFCKNTKADIRHGGLRAYHSRDADFIKMPHEHHFVDTKQATATENYYAKLTTLKTFLDAAECWSIEDKVKFIIAVGALDYERTEYVDGKNSLDIQLFKFSTMKRFAEYMIEHGSYSNIPKDKIKLETVLEELEADYSEIIIGGVNYIFLAE